ncbi:hypothetical protein VTN00DRAFT_344 [Thermoascus crustaceus]|uniref:uncharacterized protein n=1 Tax=Thermoascus crustaceus TaxID=5088 RepID=UPI00374248C2
MLTHLLGRHLEEPSEQNLIASGHLANLHRLSNDVVRKVPSDRSYPTSTRAIQTEARVYRRLGKDKRIARYITLRDDYIDLKYEHNGDLQTYLEKHQQVPHDFVNRAARQAVKAVNYIHQNGVVHSDLAARQFLLDDGMHLRLSDFAGASLDGSGALIIENATHYLPRDEVSHSSMKTDIFALGSTLYEIMKGGEKPYGDKSDEEVQELYSRKEFPNLDFIQDGSWKRIIEGCWKGWYESTQDILPDLPAEKRFRFHG